MKLLSTTALFALLSTSALAAPQVPPASKNFTGDMTYTTPGLGSCGYTNNGNQRVVGLSKAVMANGPNPNTNPKCGQFITITHGGKTAQAKVVDTCNSCATGDINVSPIVFKEFAPLSTGRITNVVWHFNK